MKAISKTKQIVQLFKRLQEGDCKKGSELNFKVI